jgi:hypothetical protein
MPSPPDRVLQGLRRGRDRSSRISSAAQSRLDKNCPDVTAVLATKLFEPPVSRALLSRPRLVELGVNSRHEVTEQARQQGRL